MRPSLWRDYNRALRIFRMLRATTYTALLCFVFLAPLGAQQGRGGWGAPFRRPEPTFLSLL
jgi:hypothetical protein